jgi:hypothetical protein
MESKIAPPLGKTVEAGGETFTIRPFGFGQLPFVAARLSGPFMALAGSGRKTFQLDELVANGGDGMMDVLAVAIKKDRAWLDELDDYEGGKRLLAAMWEVCGPQLTGKVLPDVLMAMAKMMPKKKAAPDPQTTPASA